MKAYGVPWMAPLKDHPLFKALRETRGTRGLVSKKKKISGRNASSSDNILFMAVRYSGPFPQFGLW